MKSSVSGQSQMLIPVLVILTSALVLAANATLNMTSPTGNFLPIVQTQEKSFSVEVWANTSLSLEIEESNAKALLLLDNGTALEGQEVKFYLNESFIGSNLTDSQGIAYFFVNSSGNLKAVFEGSEYLNPTYTEISIYNESEEFFVYFVDPTPANNQEINNNWIFVNVSLNKPGFALLEWNGINETMLGSDINFYLNKTDLKDDEYFYKVYAYDNLGNWKTTETRIVKINSLKIKSSGASIIGESWPSNQIVIEKQDYIDKYINWSFKEINNTHWLVNFSIDSDFLDDMKSLKEDEICNKYLRNYCTNDESKTKLFNDLKNIKKYPLKNLTKKIFIEKSEIDISLGYGSFYIVFPEGFKEGERAKFGFNSTIIS
ncbi:MAG: hypothetical protein QXD43_01120, partial [Candidatus Aenigmatarchaeota archaeon]